MSPGAELRLDRILGRLHQLSLVVGHILVGQCTSSHRCARMSSQHARLGSRKALTTATLGPHPWRCDLAWLEREREPIAVHIHARGALVRRRAKAATSPLASYDAKNAKLLWLQLRTWGVSICRLYFRSHCAIQFSTRYTDLSIRFYLHVCTKHTHTHTQAGAF